MREITSPEVPTHDSLSRALKVGKTVYVSGSGPFDAKGNLVGEDINEQTAKTLEVINTLLKEAGTSLDQAVKTTVFLKDLPRDFSEFDREYRKYVSEPYPTRTTVEAGDIGSSTDKLLVEIDVIAMIP